MSDIVLANAHVVTADAVFHGGISVVGGKIQEIWEGDKIPAGSQDLGKDFLLPGCIEIHTDNVEKHMVPRPGVLWPSPLAAILAHDAQMTAAGVTTVYDAIAVGEYLDRNYRRALLKTVMDAVAKAKQEGLFRADHYVHLRCEIADDIAPELFKPYANDPVVRLISLMDHTPGQRQWRDLKSFKVYKNENMPDKEFEEYVSSRIASASKNVNANRRKILDLWQGRGPVASHDDTTPDHVLEAISDNILISEFPTTMEAAEAAKKAGMRTVMGGPNVARGGSHSGNVSAIDLASAGLLDALSSDYAPISLIQAAFKLDDIGVMKLPQAVATVSKNPAEMLGHVDRGEIVVGKRADLVRVRKIDGSAIVRGTWVSGVQAA